ncbi:MAG: short-subunit dehydrogenase [Halioglobus sp.]|jgi:short-subunit dehydrogenase
MKNDECLDRYGATALVTGASSGIGEQFAILLAAKGFDLLITARREDKLASLKERLEKEHKVTVSYFACDLCEPVEVEALIERAQSMNIGLVVSNAGYGVSKGEFLSIEQDALSAMYQANSLAPARIARALLPSMVQAKRGGFIFTGSMEGDAVFPLSAAYAASKAFLHSLVMALWYEVKSSGVDVLLLAPGSTDTNAPISQGISRDQLVGVMSPAAVAEQALAHLGKQPHFTPGFHNRFFVALLRLLPKKMAIALAGGGMKQAMQKSAA